MLQVVGGDLGDLGEPIALPHHHGEVVGHVRQVVGDVDQIGPLGRNHPGPEADPDGTSGQDDKQGQRQPGPPPLRSPEITPGEVGRLLGLFLRMTRSGHGRASELYLSVPFLPQRGHRGSHPVGHREEYAAAVGAVIDLHLAACDPAGDGAR